MPKIIKKNVTKPVKVVKPALAKNSVEFMAEIRDLESCISADQTKLAKAYPKVFSALEKVLDKAKKELKKYKATNKKNAKNKKSVIKPIDISGLLAELKALEAEKKTLKLHYRQFKDQQKLLTKLEKSWAKQAKKIKKTKKKPVKYAKKVKKIAEEAVDFSTNP
jgi:hypothetical protein